MVSRDPLPPSPSAQTHRQDNSKSNSGGSIFASFLLHPPKHSVEQRAMRAFINNGNDVYSSETKGSSIWQQRVETGTSTTRTRCALDSDEPRQAAQQSLKHRNGCNSGAATRGRPRPRDTGCVDQLHSQPAGDSGAQITTGNGRMVGCLLGQAQGSGRPSDGLASVAAASVQSALHPLADIPNGGPLLTDLRDPPNTTVRRSTPSNSRPDGMHAHRDKGREARADRG